MMRVLHVFGRLERGGAELRTLEVLQRIPQAAVRSSFVALSGLPGELDGKAREFGGDVYYCSLGAGFTLRLFRLIRQHRFEAVHSHVHYFSGYVLLIAWMCGVRQRIVHFRNTSDGQPNTLRRVLQRSLFRILLDYLATDILAVSTGSMTEAWRADWSRDPRCRVVLNGLDVEPYSDTAAVRQRTRANLKIAATVPLFIHVGSFQQSKNHRKVIRVFDRIRKTLPDAQLLMVGRGIDVGSEPRTLVAALGLGNSVHFLGVRQDVPALLAAADVMLFPSLWEGLPGAVLEACAAGVQIIASNLPGVEELRQTFPHIVTLNPADDDDRWAAEATAAIRRDRVPVDLAGFDRGPFGLGTAARSLREVYGIS